MLPHHAPDSSHAKERGLNASKEFICVGFLRSSKVLWSERCWHYFQCEEREPTYKSSR